MRRNICGTGDGVIVIVTITTTTKEPSRQTDEHKDMNDLYAFVADKSARSPVYGNMSSYSTSRPVAPHLCSIGNNYSSIQH